VSKQTDFVFLHGGGQAGWVWSDTIEALHQQTAGAFGRALALDAPGCGAKRGRAVETLRMEDIARELVADIEAVGLSDVVLVGHSQAGQAIPFMAKLAPRLFQRLVYVTCSIPQPGQSVQAMMVQSLHGTNDDEVGWPFDPKARDLAQSYPLMFCNDMDAEQTAQFMSQLGQDSWPPRTYAMTNWCYEGIGMVPATYVVCLKDNILPVGWQEAFAARFKAERRVYIDAGHQAMNTRPHALAEVLRHEAN
jgi:pimeloyl-ACP methyl ester carboxylesterase